MIAEATLHHHQDHTIEPILPSTSLSDAWADPQARARLECFVANGILRSEPAAACIVLKVLSDSSDATDECLLAKMVREVSIAGLTLGKEQSFNKDEAARVKRRADQIVACFEDDTPTSFVDIGCGNGMIAETLRQRWEIPTERAVGVDVHERLSPLANIRYAPVGADGELSDVRLESMDVALMLMTLHHEPDPYNLFEEVARVLEPGGRLLIRDHDASSPSDVLFCRAMNRLYYGLFNQGTDVHQPGNYHSSSYWLRTARAAGFVLEFLDNPEPGSPMNPFHAVLRKPAV